ncbi:MAG: hypothetical protein ACI8UD_002853, partial [Planctomycetota bacterium]
MTGTDTNRGLTSSNPESGNPESGTQELDQVVIRFAGD